MANNNKQHSEAVVKRVSRKHDDGGHGGSWKVAFADFCLALMCLFLVLWVLAARDKEQLEESLRESSASMLEGGERRIPDPIGAPSGSLIPREPIPSRGETTSNSKHIGNTDIDPDPARMRLKSHYESASDLQELALILARLSEQSGLAGNLQTVVTPYGLRVMLHDTDREGMFERGSAVPSEKFKQLLRKMGPLFAQIDNQMLIVGHTDSKPYLSRAFGAPSNWSLSSNRAMAARVQLLEGGMNPHSVLQVVGMAERAPLDTQDSTAGINRRIELLILTTGQAQMVSSMFGVPDKVAPLFDGVDSAVPDADQIDQLRRQFRAGAAAGAR